MANSVLKAFTQHCLIIVVKRALMNIIKCCFLGVLTSLLRHCRQLIVAIRTELYGLTTQMLVFFQVVVLIMVHFPLLATLCSSRLALAANCVATSPSMMTTWLRVQKLSVLPSPLLTQAIPTWLPLQLP